MITIREIYKCSHAGASFPSALLCDQIENVTNALRRSCFGDPFWDYMNEFLNDITGAAAYDCTVIYDIDDVVLVKDTYYISLINLNSETPVGSSNWEVLPKFSNSCAQEIWDKYLGQIIGNEVFIAALPFSVVQVGAGGMFIQNEDSKNQRPLTLTEVASFQATVTKTVVEAKKGMDEWLESQPTGCNIPKTLTCKQDCNTAQRGLRRIWA